MHKDGVKKHIPDKRFDGNILAQYQIAIFEKCLLITTMKPTVHYPASRCSHCVACRESTSCSSSNSRRDLPRTKRCMWRVEWERRHPMQVVFTLVFADNLHAGRLSPVNEAEFLKREQLKCSVAQRCPASTSTFVCGMVGDFPGVVCGWFGEGEKKATREINGMFRRSFLEHPQNRDGVENGHDEARGASHQSERCRR